MPRREGMASEPGRSSVSEKKRASGAEEEEVIERTLEARTAPSAGTWTLLEMTEFAGRASPRTPLKSEESGSFETEVAAAVAGGQELSAP